MPPGPAGNRRGVGRRRAQSGDEIVVHCDVGGRRFRLIAARLGGVGGAPPPRDVIAGAPGTSAAAALLRRRSPRAAIGWPGETRLPATGWPPLTSRGFAPLQAAIGWPGETRASATGWPPLTSRGPPGGKPRGFTWVALPCPGGRACRLVSFVVVGFVWLRRSPSAGEEGGGPRRAFKNPKSIAFSPPRHSPCSS